MGFKLTDVEFAYKVDSEGGIFGALLGYGLTAEDFGQCGWATCEGGL